jgi:ferredoxin
MKYVITAQCVNCHACKLVCPNQAVYYDTQAGRFRIHPRRCNGCETHYATPQCATICPVEEAIIDQQAIPVNPKGSLTGIPLGIDSQPTTIDLTANGAATQPVTLNGENA